MSGRRGDPSGRRGRRHHRHGHHHGKIIINNFCGCCSKDKDTTEEDVCDCEDWLDLKEKIERLVTVNTDITPVIFEGKIFIRENTGAGFNFLYCDIGTDGIFLDLISGLSDIPDAGIHPECACWENIIRAMAIAREKVREWSVDTERGVLLENSTPQCSGSGDSISFGVPF